MKEGISFNRAFEIASQTFSYTNHTVMAEALEKWDVSLFKSVLPEVFDIIYQINAKLCGELMARRMDCSKMSIIQGKTIHMANLAVYCSRYVNGVAELHTEILKNDCSRTGMQSTRALPEQDQRHYPAPLAGALQSGALRFPRRAHRQRLSWRSGADFRAARTSFRRRRCGLQRDQAHEEAAALQAD